MQLINDGEYAVLWQTVEKQLLEISALDADFELVFGAKTHRYQRMPVVDESLVLTFEQDNGIRLPESYRTYLQAFAGGGVGPGHGIESFNDYVRDIDVSESSSLKKPAKGSVDYDIDEDHPVHSLHGVARIGTAGNPSDYFLVLNGDLAGEVFWWNYGDAVGFEGPFDHWYQRWLDKISVKLKNYHAFAKVNKNMSWHDIKDLMEVPCQFTQGDLGKRVARFENTPGYLELSDTDEVLNVVYVAKPEIT